MKKYFFVFFSVLCFILLFFSCKKDSEIVVDNNISLLPGTSGSIILQGYSFDLLDGILLSSNNLTIFNSPSFHFSLLVIF